MTDDRQPSIPLLGDTSLENVQRLEHSLGGGFVSTRIANLPGEVQQRASRTSHRIRIAGLLFGSEAAGHLETLQLAAETGEELNFAADITAALDLQKVVISGFRAVEIAGHPDRFAYEITLAESPPLPPPAQVEGFGGLDDFGLGDMGFDTDVLGDLEDLAGDIAGAVDAALDVVDQLEALAGLANLDGLELGNFMSPLDDAVSQIGEAAGSFKDAAQSLSEAFSS